MGWNDLIGMRLDQYDILDELGRGGSSRVYKARDIELDRDVAIKVIPNDAEDRALFINRFTREVEAVQQLHHPNIVAVFGAGENDELVYLVMQCVTGGTLRRKLTGPLPVQEAAAYMVQIAFALHHAHERGIIHRDVKPSNMLLEYPGSNHVLLTDFGIAKIQGARGLTKSGTTIGTPEYMSPEQAEGRDIDERSDIYALGCVLYETLAGRPPFLGSTPVSVLFQQVHSRTAYIRGFNPGVPAELVEILEIALAKRPDERFGTAESFARALRPFAGDLPDLSAQPPGGGRIVIARSSGLSQPLPRHQRLRQNDVADRDTIQQYPGRRGVTDETTSPLPAISSRRTMPPHFPHRHTMPPVPALKDSATGRPRRTGSPARTRKTGNPGRVRKTLPPFVRVRRASSISEWNLTLQLFDQVDLPADGPPASASASATAVDNSPSPQFGVPSPHPPTQRAPISGPSRPYGGYGMIESGQRGSNSGPGSLSQRSAGGAYIPPTWPRTRRSPRIIAVLFAAAVVLAVFAALALNVTGLGFAFGGHPQATATLRPTAAATATSQPTATPAPTNTAGPQPTATPSQQQILNQRASGSFRAVTIASFSDSSCSGGNSRNTFNSGQTIYVNLCTSSFAVSAPMTVSITQGGQVVYTMVKGRYISPSSSYFYYTSHVLNSGTYHVVVTLTINGTTAVARDMPLYIR